MPTTHMSCATPPVPPSLLEAAANPLTVWGHVGAGSFEDVTDDLATSLYIRTRIPLCDDSGNETGEIAWIYLYNKSVEAFPPVADGNWPLDAGKTRK